MDNDNSSEGYLEDLLDLLTFPDFNESSVIGFMKVWGQFDAGGTHTSLDRQGRPPIAVSVAGYLATPRQWIQFDKEWSKGLNEVGLAYFHMAEFVARKGIFAKLTDKERADLIPRLIGIISANVIYGLGMAVLRADYDRLMAEEPQAGKVLGSPYAFCAFRCFESATDWAIDANYNESIRYVFEDSDEFKHQVMDTHTFICKHDALREKYRFLGGSLTFEDGKKSKPLQAADILAWEMNRELNRRAYPNEDYPYTRNSMMALFEIGGDYKSYTEEELREYLRDFAEDRRPFLIVVPPGM